MKRANGEGTIYWSEPKKRWIAAMTVAGKKTVFYGARGDKSRAAKTGVRDRMAVVQAQRGPNAGADTLGHYLAAWLDQDTSLRAKTQSLYRYALKKITADPIAQKMLVEVSPTDIRGLYGRIPSASVAEKVHVFLRRVLEEAVRMEVLMRNPAAAVRKPKVPRREMRVWSPEQIKLFIEIAIDHRLYALFVLALTSTMGPAELFGLRRSDLHLGSGYLVVNRNLENVNGVVKLADTKTAQRRRRIDLAPFTVAVLRQRLQLSLAEGHAGSGYVFTSPAGGPIRIENFRRRVWDVLLDKAQARDAGFPRIRLYDLRHTAAALMGHLGVPIFAASRRMGHANPSLTLNTYSHLYDVDAAGVAITIGNFFSNIEAKG